MMVTTDLIGRCKKCIHYNVCADEYKNKLRCADYKDKADFVEVKDCNLCAFNSRHATEYPCSHCKNCYTDKFKPIADEGERK